MGSSHPESKLELCGKAALPQGVGVWSPRSDSPGLPATPGAGDRVWECILLGEVVFLGLVFIYFFKDVLLKKQRDVFHLLDHNTPPIQVSHMEAGAHMPRGSSFVSQAC